MQIGLKTYINIKGEFVIQPSFDEPGIFSEGLAKVANMAGNGNGSLRYFYINKTGQNVFKDGSGFNRDFRYATDFNNATAEVKDGNGKKFFIDLKGNEVGKLNDKLYNHFSYSKKPYGGDLSKSLVLDKRGNPVDVKYSASKQGYADEFARPITEAIYSSASEFRYSYKTPASHFSTNESENTINTAADIRPDSLLISVVAKYKKTELLDGDEGGVNITFVQEDGKEIIFDGYNPKSKLIPLDFICGTCKPDNTVKINAGRKYLVKYYIQKREGENGIVEEHKIFEWFTFPE